MGRRLFLGVSFGKGAFRRVFRRNASEFFFQGQFSKNINPGFGREPNFSLFSFGVLVLSFFWSLVVDSLLK